MDLFYERTDMENKERKPGKDPGNTSHLKALELDKILEMLKNETAVKDAAQMAIDTKPAYTLREVEERLAETDAAYVLVARFGAPSFYGLSNVTNPVRRAQAGGSLNMAELLRVASTLRAVRSLKQWREKSAGMTNSLDGRFQALSPKKELEERIFSAVLSEEEMADNASSVLANIRRKIRNASASVRDKLDKLIHSQTHQKHLQDAIVTQRSGRFVVPVKNEFRSEVPGLVHDTSASGATVFVEPIAVVEANNEIRMLQSAEREEINRILDELSGFVGRAADDIVEGYDHAVMLDYIFAKAHLAYRLKAVMPKVNDEGRINLYRARHPLIDPKRVVPIDLTLGTEFDALIITGPNTGGKTVALKTAGVMTLMAMCGLMIPAAQESEVSVFRNVLADIGDEQSIEQSLSTFSAHMTNIIRILEKADEHSLVLLDELGAGTDPVEGAALATAIIEELRCKGVRLACTTHYAELKAYALETAGVENGCCEFDVQTLRPTYRLLIGVPGKSNAFAISQRLGISAEVVDRARELVSTENSRFESVVDKLEESRRRMEDETKQARRHRTEAEQRAAEAERLKEEAEKRAEQEIERARKQAEEIIIQTRRQADVLLSELEDMKKQQNKQLTAEQKARMRAGLRELDVLANPVREKDDGNYVLPRALKQGDDVLIYDIDRQAVVLEEPKGDTVLVQAGIIKTRVELRNLRLLDKQKVKAPRGKGERTVTKSITREVTTDVDLRGKNAEEALMEVDAALSHAVLSGIKQMTIIHGKGTGILRAAVQQHLRKSPVVKSFRLGIYGEGESGVTIAELK